MHTTDGHILYFSWTESEHRETISAFIREGLSCRAAIYILSRSYHIESLLDSLGQSEMDIETAKARGQIVMLPAEDILNDQCDSLDVESTQDWLDRCHRDAMAKGFAAFWITMEMTWALERFPDDDRLLRLEASLHEYATSHQCTIASHYDIAQTDTGRLVDILRTAKKVGLGGDVIDSPFFTPADTLLGAASKPTMFNQMIESIEAGRKRDTLLDSEDLLRALFREIDVGFVLFEVVDTGDARMLDFVAVQANPVAADLNNAEEDDIVGKSACEIFPVQDDEIIDILSEVALTGASARFERFKPDTHQYFEVIAFRPKQELCAALVTDITERRRLEDVRRRSEFRIRQTQKMEAIGRLASGVAHDFNNILTAIVGLSDVLMEELPSNQSEWRDVKEIRKAAHRAASLTKQLLAFSRKQVIAPKVINLNRIVEDYHRMLARIIGEDIHLVFEAESALKSIKIDPSQMEQILANFAANARDAMPTGGALSIRTENVSVDEPIITAHGEVLPGNYVRLTVEDNGIGMTEEVQDRIFEPFFTTKGKTRGTGLGLATVYGIVRQNRGSILVHSVADKGTRFEIYLPWSVSEIPTTESIVPPRVTPGTGTVLLAEDEESVRILTRRILERSGYNVISASSGEEAMLLFESEGFRIDLLLTDVVMPGINGVELYTALAKQRPDLPVLYISGYPEDVISEHGMRMGDVHLLEKPFSPEALTTKIGDLIGSA